MVPDGLLDLFGLVDACKGAVDGLQSHQHGRYAGGVLVGHQSVDRGRKFLRSDHRQAVRGGKYSGRTGKWGMPENADSEQCPKEGAFPFLF